MSPAPIASSMSSTSGASQVATAKLYRIFIPAEYVRTGTDR